MIAAPQPLPVDFFVLRGEARGRNPCLRTTPVGKPRNERHSQQQATGEAGQDETEFFHQSGLQNSMRSRFLLGMCVCPVASHP